jgi:cytochrome P450 family 2 subfamily J
MLEYILLSLLIGGLLYLFLTRTKDDPRLPHGPKGYPVIGSLLDVNPDRAYLKITEWAKKYGEVYSFKMMGQVFIVLNSSEVIRDAMLTKPHTVQLSARPRSFVGKYIMHNNADIILGNYDKDWAARRKVVHRLIKLHGEGGAKIETLVIKELQKAIGEVGETNGKPFDPYQIVMRALTAIVGGLVSISE